MKNAAWNPHYLAYANAHGCTPEDQFARDESATGNQLAFVLWIASAWRQWRALRARDRYERAEDFAAWVRCDGVTRIEVGVAAHEIGDPDLPF